MPSRVEFVNAEDIHKAVRDMNGALDEDSGKPILVWINRK
jgi:hypothetical protein